MNPPHEMKISQKFDNDPEVILADDREHRTSFYTDGRKLEKDKDADDKQVSARWDDKKLVTDEKGAHGGKVSRTYELSSDGKQLIETVHVTDSKGNHPVIVQYVLATPRMIAVRPVLSVHYASCGRYYFLALTSATFEFSNSFSASTSSSFARVPAGLSGSNAM